MTPTAAVRSILGDPSGTLSEARCREVVVAVLRACREPTTEMYVAGGEVRDADHARIGGFVASAAFTAMIDALIEEVTAEGGRIKDD